MPGLPKNFIDQSVVLLDVHTLPLLQLNVHQCTFRCILRMMSSLDLRCESVTWKVAALGSRRFPGLFCISSLWKPLGLTYIYVY